MQYSNINQSVPLCISPIFSILIRPITSASRTVDRRTKTLYITGFSGPASEVATYFAVTTFNLVFISSKISVKSISILICAFTQQFGIIAHHKQDDEIPALTVTYDHRKSAEIALTKGRTYKEHQLEIKWVQNNPTAPQTKDFDNNGSTLQAEDADSGEGDEVC